MSQCAICGQPLKTIPAGISKNTGKPYPSFEACPNKCKQPRVWEQRPTNQPVLQQENIQNRIDKAIADKKESIAWMNAKNNACLLIAHGIFKVEQLKDVANIIYKLEPEK